MCLQVTGRALPRSWLNRPESVGYAYGGSTGGSLARRHLTRLWANHFIVVKADGGPGKDSAGRPFYGPYDVQNLESEIGRSERYFTDSRKRQH